MKHVKFISVLALFVTVALLVAFTPATGDKYKFGNRSSVMLNCDPVVAVNPGNLTLTYAVMAMDTNAVINVSTSKSILGDRITFECTALTRNRRITFNDNITAITDSVLTGKTKVFEFVFNGTDFVQASEIQIN